MCFAVEVDNLFNLLLVLDLQAFLVTHLQLQLVCVLVDKVVV